MPNFPSPLHGPISKFLIDSFFSPTSVLADLNPAVLLLPIKLPLMNSIASSDGCSYKNDETLTLTLGGASHCCSDCLPYGV